MKNYPSLSDCSPAEIARWREMDSEILEPIILSEEEYMQLLETRNSQERFCSGTFRADIISEDGFEILKKKGLL